MRKQIIETLAFSRALVRDGLDPQDCAHDTNYDPEDRGCVECEYGPECRWLFENDEFAALERKPLEHLVDALEFALAYVAARTRSHNRHTCRCDICHWQRQAQKLRNSVPEPG
jgi:hypothetical protein